MTFETPSADMETAFARIQAIRWDAWLTASADDEARNKALTELMSEFLSGIRQWATYLRSNQVHAFENLAIKIDPELQIPAHMKEWLDELKESDRVEPWRGRNYVLDGLYNYLCWCHLRAKGKVPPAELPDPYEPLIRFFEQGGAISVEHGYYMDVYPSQVTFMLNVKREGKRQAEQGL